MGLQRKQNNLRKAQARFDKVSRRSKQFQIDFRREQNNRGNYHTRAYIVRGEKQFHGNNRGLIHKAVKIPYQGRCSLGHKDDKRLETEIQKGKGFQGCSKGHEFCGTRCNADGC